MCLIVLYSHTNEEVYGDIMRITITPHYMHSGALRICEEGRLEIIKRREG
jgi:hypothetical protein